MTDRFQWSVDRFSYFRGQLSVEGWALHESPILAVAVKLPDGSLLKTPGYGLPSPDVEALFGERARKCRFSIDVPVGDPATARGAALVFRLPRRKFVEIANPTQELGREPHHVLFAKFVEMVKEADAPEVVEIGSRARSGNEYHAWVPTRARYVGFDVAPGPNVEVVGDAHELSRHFAPSSVDFVFSISTMEHLAMPWKFSLELNKILKLGGISFHSTHQTWPLHDQPHDFWRFSSHTWRVLFNEATGFEVVEAAMGEPASVVGKFLHPPTTDLDLQPAYLGSAVIVRKIGESDLEWDLPVHKAVEGIYPE